MKIIILSLLCWVSEAFDPDLSEDIHNYTKNEMHLKLFDDTGYPEQGDIPLLNRKVFKGTRVSIREHAYVLSIRRRVSHYCMGTLMTKNIVLTVAHPLIEVPINELSVVAGENYADRGAILLTVVLVIIHEHFDRYNLANDICLIRIYENITYRGSIKSIRLVSPSAQLSGKRGFVTGWGRCDRTGRELCLPRTSRYFPGEKLDPMLRSVSFVINIPTYYCEGYKRNDVNILPGMLCVGTAREEDPVCPCLAAPGAPLVVDGRLAALQSWGFGCGYAFDLPLVYTSVQYFQPWLLHNIPILRNIHQKSLSGLFEATRAALQAEWLRKTRLLPPDQHTHPEQNLEFHRFDIELLTLRGTVYDIRDFLYDGVHRTYKLKAYVDLREKLAKNERMQIFGTMNPPIASARPFLSLNDSSIEEVFANGTDLSDSEDPNNLFVDIFALEKRKNDDSYSSYED